MCCEYSSIWFTFISFCNMLSVSDLVLLPTPHAVCCLTGLCDRSFGSRVDLSSSFCCLYSWLTLPFKSQVKHSFLHYTSAHSSHLYIYTFFLMHCSFGCRSFVTSCLSFVFFSLQSVQYFCRDCLPIYTGKLLFWSCNGFAACNTYSEYTELT